MSVPSPWRTARASFGSRGSRPPARAAAPAPARSSAGTRCAARRPQSPASPGERCQRSESGRGQGREGEEKRERKERPCPLPLPPFLRRDPEAASSLTSRRARRTPRSAAAAPAGRPARAPSAGRAAAPRRTPPAAPAARRAWPTVRGPQHGWGDGNVGLAELLRYECSLTCSTPRVADAVPPSSSCRVRRSAASRTDTSTSAHGATLSAAGAAGTAASASASAFGGNGWQLEHQSVVQSQHHHRGSALVVPHPSQRWRPELYAPSPGVEWAWIMQASPHSSQILGPPSVCLPSFSIAAGVSSSPGATLANFSSVYTPDQL